MIAGCRMVGRIAGCRMVGRMLALIDKVLQKSLVAFVALALHHLSAESESESES